MILHESPDTTILELLPANPQASDSSDTASAAAEAALSSGLALSGPQRARYAVLGSPPPDGAGAAEYLELKPGEAAEVKFDLVILGQGCGESINDWMSLPFLLDHVKPGGRLICGFDCGRLLGKPQPVPQDCRVDVFADHTGPVTLFHAVAAPAAAVADGDSHAPDKVLIVEPPTPTEGASVSAFSKELAKTLQGHGLRPLVVAWTPELATQLSSGQHHTVISLLELDRPFMERLSGSDFALVQAMILKATSLLWLTALSGPSASVIDGALRVARRELGNPELKVLHLSAFSLRRGPELAARVLASPTRDTEFLEDGDGLLKVSRVFEDQTLNADVSSHAGTGTHLTSIKMCDFPLALGISKPGLLDTLHFRPQEDAGELKENEVEIQIKASGVK